MQHVMEVTMNTNHFHPLKDLEVAVFEYWTVKGELIRECVPLADAYNCDRVSESHAKVGFGRMLKADKPGRWDKADWLVEWDRQQPTPDYPYAGWKRRLVSHHFRQILKFIRNGRAYLLPEIYDRRMLSWLWQEIRS